MKRQNLRRFLIIFSFFLLPITQFYFSPYLVILGLNQGIIAGSFILFSLLFVGSLLFGRIFCGWIMPCGGLQEICFSFQNKRVNPKKIQWIKYIIWVPWVGFIIYLLLRFSGIFHIDFTFQTDHGISIYNKYLYIIYYTVLLIILILSLTVGRRASCHAICWMSPFMILGSRLGKLLKIPALKLKAQSEKCISCGICTKQCPMSLNVQEMVQNNKMFQSECILCGNCVDQCPKNAILFGYGKR